MFYMFVSNTPLWVWPLLLGLLVLGLRQTRTKHMGWMRVTIPRSPLPKPQRQRQGLKGPHMRRHGRQ